MTAARVKCNRLLKEGNLISNKGYMPTFAEYAQGWWERKTCACLKKRRKRHNLTRTYADNNKKNLKNHLIPYFGKMPVNKISRDDIEAWFDKLVEEECQNPPINGYFGTLKTMMIEAVARKIIILEEFKKLFVKDWKRVWDNDRISYTANKLAALMGMGASEVLGLKAGLCTRTTYTCASSMTNTATGIPRPRTNTMSPCLPT
jgi:hypothetical protein